MRRIFSLLTFLAILSTGVFAHNEWVGEFSFDEDGGETAGGSKILVSHTLDIKSRPDGSYSAKLLSQGFQTSNDILGEAKVNENVLSFFYKSKGPDHNGPEFKENELLFRIYIYEGNYFTIWEAFKPALESSMEQAKVRFTPSEKGILDRKDIRWTKIDFPKAKFAITVPNHFIYQRKLDDIRLGVLKVSSPGFAIHVVTEPGKDPGYASYLLRANAGEEKRFGKSMVWMSGFRNPKSRSRMILILGEERFTTIRFTSRDRRILDSFESLLEIEGRRLAPMVVSPEETIAENKIKKTKTVKKFSKLKLKFDPSKIAFVKTESHGCPFDNTVERSPIFLASNNVGLTQEELPERTVTVCFMHGSDGTAKDIVVKSVGPKNKSVDLAIKLIERARIIPALKNGQLISAPVVLTFPGSLG